MANWPPLSADRQARTMKIDLNKYFRFVIPAQAGIQNNSEGIDSCFRRNDGE
jgi:hypothetical protein